MRIVLLLSFVAVLNAGASLSLKAASANPPPLGDVITALVPPSPFVAYVLLAIACWGSAFVVYFFALRLLPASWAYSLSTGMTITLLTVAEMLKFSAMPSLLAVFGLIMIGAGILLLAYASG